MHMEKTFIMVKPDGVQRGLIGEIVARFESKGFKLAGAKLMSVSEELAKEHYGEHRERPFFGELVDFITSAPVFAMVWEVEVVISTSRTLIEETNPTEAARVSISGDYSVTFRKNINHGSDSTESTEREIGLFLQDDNIINYTKDNANWIY